MEFVKAENHQLELQPCPAVGWRMIRQLDVEVDR